MTAPRAVRRYPRDVPVGTRVVVRLAAWSGPARRVVGTVTTMDKVRGGYHVHVDLPDGSSTHWVQSANAKLDVATGR